MSSQHGRVCTFINAEMGMGLFQAYTYILKMTLLLKVLQGKAGRGSKVGICPALTCCFSISKWLMGYLLTVRQDVFFSFSQILFFCKKLFHVYWLGSLNTIIFYLVFFLRKLLFGYLGKAKKTTFFTIYFL